MVTHGVVYFLKVDYIHHTNTDMKPDGRPARLGSMFFDRVGDRLERKFSTGYCQGCGSKQGLTSFDLREFDANSPGYFTRIVKMLWKTRVSFPQ